MEQHISGKLVWAERQWVADPGQPPSTPILEEQGKVWWHAEIQPDANNPNVVVRLAIQVPEHDEWFDQYPPC
jgi:hypothetical protein